ncbi:MAG: phosphoenolpyruvate carboxykinase (ATP) [Thermomicrobiales bacterium]|nr:phosphoenolpyruvate carboxykinase (ATP) [Thermomicrobiales bacterium]MCO5221976.1 phosphoenolpyruvate carboxykinase (ATP) [Thermomicrobiales bacterium]
MTSLTVSPIDTILRTAVHDAPVPVLYEHALRSGAGQLALGGSLAVSTGSHTGRSPLDRFIVDQAATHDTVDWNDINRPLAQDAADRLSDAVAAYLLERSCYVQNLGAGADRTYRLPIRVVTPSPWHALFAETMFIRPDAATRAAQTPAFTVLHAPEFEPDPASYGLRSSTFIVVDFERKTILIGGTEYAGEIKKSIFSVMNFLLPERNVLPMHCSCNAGKDDDVALFFGLSGTGKTTLSADPNRILIGDDEHGWTADGVFNFEGGCYAKVIDLRQESEPEIYATTRMFGTVLENVVVDPETRIIDFDDDRFTQNTRAAYPLSSIPNASESGVAGHPTNVIMLTADAFGVLPPVARLTTDQALYYFLSGYTSKVAGTEIGVTDPEATFSAGFGAPFLPRRPTDYAELLASYLETYGAQAWLVNTGWTGGPYGTGHRMPIDATRAVITAILNGTLSEASFVADPVIGLSIPRHCPGVPDELLAPRDSWNDPAAYDAMAARLIAMFAENFQQFVPHVSAGVAASGPGS